MAGPTAAFERFLESFHAPRSDRRHANDFNLGALAELRRPERERAERLLIGRLEGDPSDNRTAGGLALVGSPAAIEPLRHALGRSIGLARVRIASALAKLDQGFDPIEVYLEALKTGDFSLRGAAAGELAASPRERVREPLLEALADPSFGVRVAVFEALLGIYELKVFREPRYSPLRTVGMRLLSDLPAVVGPAVDEMRSIISALDAGESPKAIGLTRGPAGQEADLQRALDSFNSPSTRPPWDRDLDLEAIGRLDGFARRYLECVLLAELHAGDRRVRRALEALRSQAAVVDVRGSEEMEL